MAEVLGLASSIAGIIGLGIQIGQVLVKFGLDWKDGPKDCKRLMAELQSLNSVLAGVANLLANPDFINALQYQDSVLQQQLAPGLPPATGTKKFVTITEICEAELTKLLAELKKRTSGHRIGWERFKGAFLSEQTREAVENLHRECQILNGMVTVDGALIGGKTLKEVKEARAEQNLSHNAQMSLTWDIRRRVDELHEYHGEKARSKEFKAILGWLTPTDYSLEHNDFISRHQEGSGQWLLASKQFQNWIDEPGETLFCPGMPGAGKTIMTSLVVRQLHSEFHDDETVGIAYLYCNFNRQKEQAPIDLLLNLLKQFVQGQELIPKVVKDLYTEHKRRETRPSFAEVSKTLQSVMKDLSRTFIVVDALDECRISDGDVWTFLSEIFKLQTAADSNMFATSRFIPEIESEFEGRTTLEIRASPHDVERYIEGHMAQLPRFVLRDRPLQDEITSAITKAADGMFLLAQLHLASLCGKRSAKAVKLALEKLPAGSNAYDAAYDDSMKRIAGQVPDACQLALEAISWIACAQRRLTIQELRHALAVEVGTPEFDEDNLPEVEQIISVCAGLVTLDKDSGIIRFVHYTTQEYLQRGQIQQYWFPHGQRNIAGICVTYVSYETFRAGATLSDKDFEARLESYPLYDYSAKHWGDHVRISLEDEQRQQLVTPSKLAAAPVDIDGAVVSLLHQEALVAAIAQAIRSKKVQESEHLSRWENMDYSQNMVHGLKGPHLAAHFGLGDAMMTLIPSKYPPNVTDDSGYAPLHFAAGGGHESTVQKLLAVKGTDPNFNDLEDQTPLHLAAERGYDAIVKVLLAVKGIEPDSKSNLHSRTPLSWAAENGHSTTVELLLAAGADPNFVSPMGGSALSRAASRGHITICNMLLEAGVDPEASCKDDYTPLTWAASLGQVEVLKILLAMKVNPDRKEARYGRTPLVLAIEKDHDAIVKLLLAQKVDLSSRTNDGCTPLHAAASKGNHAVVEFLLAAGVDPDPKDNTGRTPLSHAAERGQISTAKLLVAAEGVDPNFKDHDGLTPKAWAEKKRYGLASTEFLESGIL